LKCDKKEESTMSPFEPESPYVIVCEGFQDVGLVCHLLKHLKIHNCDVTYPKKSDGGNGKDQIGAVIKLLAGSKKPATGILVIADADEDPKKSFAAVCAVLDKYPVPSSAFTTAQKGSLRSGVFLLPGAGKKGALEHLLLDVVRNENPGIIACVEEFRRCTVGPTPWSDNDDAKMKMQCVVAATCEKNPTCSLAWVWDPKYKTIPIRIDSPILKELSDFLIAFSS